MRGKSRKSHYFSAFFHSFSSTFYRFSQAFWSQTADSNLQTHIFFCLASLENCNTANICPKMRICTSCHIFSSFVSVICDIFRLNERLLHVHESNEDSTCGTLTFFYTWSISVVSPPPPLNTQLHSGISGVFRQTCLNNFYPQKYVRKWIKYAKYPMRSQILKKREGVVATVIR